MLNHAQWNRLTEKVANLLSVYRSYEVAERREAAVTLYETKSFYSAPPPHADYRPVAAGEEWGGEFSYGWFRTDVTLPKEWRGRAVYLKCESGAVESLVFLNEKPYGMFNAVEGAKEPMFRLHDLLRLTDSAAEQNLRLYVEGYAGHGFTGTMPYEKMQTFGLGKYRPTATYRGFFLCVKDEDVEVFLDNLSLFISLYRAQEPDSYPACGMLKGFARLFTALSLMPSDGFDREGVREANAIFSELLAGGGEKPALPYVGLVGHSHLDTAWLWHVEETKRKAARTAATAVRLLKRYPKYRFIMSSVQHLQWFERYYPDLFEDVVTLAKEGRFELNGAAWIECDCNLVSGESLVRQFLRGQLYLREKVGRYADCFWLPDTFGYSASLPQIMQKSRVPYFCTTKLSWNDTNRFPYETFLWRGIDRSRVLVHFNTIQAFPDPQTVTARIKALPNKHMSDSALIAYGYGDGGGGPDEKMVECALRTEELADVPKCFHTTVSDFMASVDQSSLPVFCGELYLELHRGTYTTNHDLKQYNRRLEEALHDAELLTCLLSPSPAADKAITDAAYDALLLNQFHDILPGTSITEVNALAKQQYAEAIANCDSLCRELLAARSKGGEGITLVNTQGFTRSGVFRIPDTGVSLSGCTFQNFSDVSGAPQRLVAARIEGFSSVTLAAGEPVKKARSVFRYSCGMLETPLYTVRFGKNMELTSLFDRDAGREVLAGRGNYFKICEDVPRLWDNWDIDADYKLKQKPAGKLLRSEVASDGALCFRIRNTYRIAEASTLVQDTAFYADTRRIDFESKLEWAEKHRLLKVYFDTDILCDQLRSEIQFGHILRATHENTAIDQARYEVCNQRWSDLTETRYGVAILNDCKYGINCEEGRLGLTLVKSGTHPDTTADAGVKYFTYSLLPHTGGFSFNSVIKPAYELNFPLLTVAGAAEIEPIARSLNEAAVIDTVKRAEDGNGVILRLYESEGSVQNTVLTFSRPFCATETNLLEEECNKLADGVKELFLTLRPFEIKTIRLT